MRAPKYWPAFPPWDAGFLLPENARILADADMVSCRRLLVCSAPDAVEFGSCNQAGFVAEIPPGDGDSIKREGGIMARPGLCLARGFTKLRGYLPSLESPVSQPDGFQTVRAVDQLGPVRMESKLRPA